MELEFITITCFLLFVALTTIVGMTLHDIRMIRINYRHSRHAKHFRSQPFVSVVVDDNISKESLESISRSDYRRFHIVFVGERVKSKIVLHLPSDTILERTTIGNAVEALSNFPSWKFVELKPIIKQPSGLIQLFHLYRTVALAPFISLRATFNILPDRHQPWPVLRRSTISTQQWKTQIYDALRWLTLIINSIVLFYFSYITVAAHQPLYLLMYLSGFTIWLVISVLEYPHFSVRQKILYTALAPVSFWYFYIDALYAPLAPIVRRISNVVAIVFWRSHQQTIA